MLRRTNTTEDSANETNNRWFLLAMGTIPVLPVLLAGFVLWQTGRLGNKNVTKILAPGTAPPPFSLTAQDGRSFRLQDYKGRAVLLVFVPSWSDKTTLAELRSLATAISRFDAAGAKVMAISGDSSKNASALYEREHFPFPLLHDANNVLAKQCGIIRGGLRTTFVIDPKGVVRFRLDNSVIDTAKHGQQLWNTSRCCLDDVIAARAHGIGKPVGDFSLPITATGDTQSLFSRGHYRATVILFLSVKCPCSNSYNERVRAMAQNFAKKSVRFVGIYANKDESATQITDHAQAHGFTFPVFRDEHGLGADHFGASITPEAFVLDSKLMLRYAGRIDDNREVPLVTKHDLVDAVNVTIAGKIPLQGNVRAFGCGILRN